MDILHEDLCTLVANCVYSMMSIHTSYTRLEVLTGISCLHFSIVDIKCIQQFLPNCLYSSTKLHNIITRNCNHVFTAILALKSSYEWYNVSCHCPVGRAASKVWGLWRNPACHSQCDGYFRMVSTPWSHGKQLQGPAVLWGECNVASLTSFIVCYVSWHAGLRF
jgi:hypothetical protein